MKKIAMMLLAVALLAAVGACALAAGWTEYVNKDGAKVYADYNTDSKVIAKLNKGDKVTVTDIVDMRGKWKAVTIKVKGKKKTGFMLSKHLDATAPCNHKWGKWTVIDKPTCTRTGYRQRQCVKCGILDDEKMPKTDHTYGSWKVTREPTCTREGQRTRTCRDCGYEEKQSIEKLPHDYKWEILEEATDHSAGKRQQVCQTCGHTEPAVSYDPDGTLRRGARGDDVRRVQQLLADQDYLTAKGVDGIFGGGMEKALMQFQKDQGLTPDGVGWPQTLQRLNHDFGPWTVSIPLTRASNGERVRVCKDCGFEQREVVDAGAIEKKRRGEDVRAIQQLLGSLGYNPGAYDGIYGAKLDTAYAAFAANNDVDFQPDRLWPAQVDALVNVWMASTSPDSFKGEGDVNTPVDLALTVTPASEAEAGGDMVTYNWTLSNMGSETCMFNALLLSYGDDPDFRQNPLTVVIDGVELKPNNANSASGSFTVASEWGEGRLNFSAMAVVESTGDVWNSNVVSY